jgi:hypothetical protein
VSCLFRLRTSLKLSSCFVCPAWLLAFMTSHCISAIQCAE